MKLVGELKLVYRTTMDEVSLDPEEIGRFLLDNVKSDAGMVKHHFFDPNAGTVAKEAVTVVRREPGSPEICPINTVIEARISFFEQECTCHADLAEPHDSTCQDFGIKAWSKERAA